MKNQASKQALVLCDNDLLFDVIELNLKQIHVETLRQKSGDPIHNLEKQSKADKPDLIVVAISLPDGEPIVTLFNESLIELIGRIPLLIISDRKFDPSPKGRIFHLNFPFNANDLRHTVQIALKQQIIQ